MGRSCPRPQIVIGCDLSAVFVDAHTLPGSLASRIANTSSGLPHGHPCCPYLLLVRDPLPPPAHFSPPFQRSNPHPSRPPQLLLTRAFSSSRRSPSLLHTSPRPFPLSSLHPSGRPTPPHPRLLVLSPSPIPPAHLSPPLSALQLPSIPPVQFRHTRTFSSSRRSPSLAHTSPRRFPLFSPHPSGPPHALSPKCSRHSHRPQRQAQRVPRRGCLLPPKSSAIPPQPSHPGLPALSEPHQHLRLPPALSLATYQPVGMIL